MTGRDDQHDSANPHLVPTPGGGGRGESAKTNNRQKTGIVAGKKRGGQPGNGNARKAVPCLSTRIRDWKRRARAALKAAQKC